MFKLDLEKTEEPEIKLATSVGSSKKQASSRKTSAAAAKLLQSHPTLCDPRQQPTRLPNPWDSPGKNTRADCHFLLQCMNVKSGREVVQSCLTLSNPMDCNPPGSSVHGVFQARVLEWGAIAFSEKTIYFWFIDQAKAFYCVDHNKLQKILQEVGIPDHLTCLLRNLYAGQEATVRTGHGTDWFQIGKEQYVKAVYCHPAYLTYIESTSREMLGWMKQKLESGLLGEISVTSDMQMAPYLQQKEKKN